MQPGGDDEVDSDSSDDGEEAARILKKIAFPDIPKKPQDASMLVTGCLQKRASKLEVIMSRMKPESGDTQLNPAQEKNLALNNFLSVHEPSQYAVSLYVI